MTVVWPYFYYLNMFVSIVFLRRMSYFASLHVLVKRLFMQLMLGRYIGVRSELFLFIEVVSIYPSINYCIDLKTYQCGWTNFKSIGVSVPCIKVNYKHLWGKRSTLYNCGVTLCLLAEYVWFHYNSAQIFIFFFLARISK